MSKIKFPKEIREKWLKALRSGKCKQTTESLELSGAYCCLGVLGRVLKIDKKVMNGVGDFSSGDINFKDACKVPKALLQVNKREKTRKNTNLCNTLIGMNDDYNKNFEEIADYIENKTIGV